MIREEVEKLRGFVFTDDELKDVILPAIHDIPIPVKKKHTSPDEWKKLEVYVKPGWMDPTVFVPVLISDDKTLCICPSIKLYKASISDITLKLEELERSYIKRLGIPVRFVLEPCDYDFAECLRDRGFENIIVPKKADSADFYKIFEVSN